MTLFPNHEARVNQELQGITNVRRTDPETSHAAAYKATTRHSDDKIAVELAQIMADGIPRIDCEMAQLMFHVTDGRVRHGRKRLGDLAMIELTGNKRRGINGGLCREWIWCGHGERASPESVDNMHHWADNNDHGDK